MQPSLAQSDVNVPSETASRDNLPIERTRALGSISRLNFVRGKLALILVIERGSKVAKVSTVTAKASSLGRLAFISAKFRKRGGALRSRRLPWDTGMSAAEKIVIGVEKRLILYRTVTYDPTKHPRV